MKTIRFLSAGDRYNYGDFLFPIIFYEYFNDYNVENYGLVNSNYSEFGAIPTKSYVKLKKEINVNEDIVIVGGGEVFFGRWADLYSLISPNFNKIYKHWIIKILERKLELFQLLIGKKGEYSPYVPKLGVPVLYNAVGGQFPKVMDKGDKLEVISRLKSSPSITVRDKRTWNSMKKNDIDSNLLPDTAVLLSEVVPLGNLTNSSLQKHNLGQRDYIVIQFGINKGPKNVEKFIYEVEVFARKHSKKVVCTPIGLSPGHQDDIVLKDTVKKAPGWIYIHPKNIYDTVAIIAKSYMFLGTSLHGAITAHTYLTICLPLNKKVKKLESFIKTWTPNFFLEPVSFSERLDMKMERALKFYKPNEHQKELVKQKERVKNHFNWIKAILNR